MSTFDDFVVRIEQRLPDLSDKEVDNLRANAERLASSGTTLQKQQAEVLLPMLDAALEERRVLRASAAAEKRKADGPRTGVRKKAAASAEPKDAL